jgi:hypothetical protein
MHWSYTFVARVVASLTLLLLALLYTLVGISQEACSGSGLYACCFKTLILLWLLFCAIYFLGFFEAGQVGLCRLYTMPRRQLTSHQQRPFQIVHDLILKPEGLEKFLVCVNVIQQYAMYLYCCDGFNNL